MKIPKELTDQLKSSPEQLYKVVLTVKDEEIIQVQVEEDSNDDELSIASKYFNK